MIEARDADVKFVPPDTGRGVGPGLFRNNDLAAVGIQRDGLDGELVDEKSLLQYFVPDPADPAKAVAAAYPPFKWMRQQFPAFLKVADRRVKLAYRRTAQGYTMELQIPAAALAPLSLKPGTSFPFSFRMQDGKNVTAAWVKPSRLDNPADDQPRTWQRVTLGGAPR